MKRSKEHSVSKVDCSEKQKDFHLACADLFVHPDIELLPDYTLNVRKIDARADEDPFKHIDLKHFWLPPNNVYDKPQRLLMRQDFLGAIALAAEKYVRGSTDSKTRNARVVFSVATLAKFFEYIWLKNRFNLAAVIPQDFDELARVLAGGGWHAALNVKKRLKIALSAEGHQLACCLLSLGQNHLHGIRRASLGQHIGTNVAAKEAAIYLKQVLQHYRDPLNEYAQKILATDDKFAEGMNYSMLRQTLEAINLLIDLPAPYGIKFLPFHNSVALAKKLTKPQMATRNLGAVEAGALIAEGYKWLYSYGEDIAALIQGMCLQVKSAHEQRREVLGHSLENWLELSDIRIRLEKKIGIKIDGLDIKKPGCYSVRELMLTLMTSCFVLVATMNGRRRDEVSHRKYGLHAEFSEVVDEELEIYRGLFYIEKTTKDHDIFYINKTTREVALLLENIQKSFDDLNGYLGRPTFSNMPKTERSLFGYHRFSRVEGVNETRNWFIFESNRDGAATTFLRLALGEDYLLVPKTHMFRRLYAVVLMYQHEIPSLQAVSQQLRHDSLGTTQIYVNDPIMRLETEQIRNKLDVSGKDRSKRFASHVLGLRKEIALVSDEMMIEKMLLIISGAPTSGGYPNLIKRFYKSISSNVDFSRLTAQAKAERLVHIVKQKGHVPDTKREGICMVGNQSRVPGARCRSKEGTPQKELASASKCSKCAYHFHNVDYLRNLNEDLDEMSMQLTNPHLADLERKRLKTSIADLGAAIRFHSGRLAACGEQS
ncbi:hypothetical protein [Noviherbaspirillum suwonense]|uniref:Tyr recombinase domain-containing protein n=1 Tax=Noviherbaspirillum suwonense TaxID=1224511 RepID=A0ABY1QQR0_9BURK|nr:hypothetical protein [Noviherbaspirillum suwonense]SMP77697.1 hypothetical protein SAMN06295970_1273 [Noviherbaspirillum suwonense]